MKPKGKRTSSSVKEWERNVDGRLTHDPLLHVPNIILVRKIAEKINEIIGKNGGE